MKDLLLGAAAWGYGVAWDARRAAYARGWRRPTAVPARVVSVGNLTWGGTGKTTLTLRLAAAALAAGRNAAVVCRRYRPGPGGQGDEERLYQAALGRERVLAGTSKRALAMRAASEHDLLLVDDGFSHWGLARDLDIVLIEAGDPWGGGHLIPRGRLREPRCALERAGVVVLSQLGPGQDPEPLLAEIHRAAPAARLAVGRHRPNGARSLAGVPIAAAGPAWVVTATGNPRSVARSVTEAGFELSHLSTYRDHHWFSAREARAELAGARRQGATLLLTAKDAVRWPLGDGEGAAVLEVAWEWERGGESVERLALEGKEAS